MKINKTTKITGKNVILVPYRECHVLKYHEWMKSPELQHLTASEPLTLEQEYEMQKSWQEDEDKCTFIVLDKSVFDKTADEVSAMVGDTNLFFNDSEDSQSAEAEVMIADLKNRGRGFGFEATLLMLRYGIEKLGINTYRVKISMDNDKSIRMFTKIGFTETSRSEVFQEITLEKSVNSVWRDWLFSETIGTTRDDNYL